MKNVQREIVKHFVKNNEKISSRTVLKNDGELFELDYSEDDNCWYMTVYRKKELLRVRMEEDD